MESKRERTNREVLGMIGRTPKPILAAIICVFLLIWGLIMASLCQIVRPFTKGIAVDSSGKIYVGQTGRILVIDPGATDEIRKMIYPQSSKSYAFTIRDDTLLVDMSYYLYAMDLNGNILNKQDMTKSVKKYFESVKTNTYTYGDRRYEVEVTVFGRDRVYVFTDGVRSVYYEQPLADYLPKPMMIVCVLSLAVLVLLFGFYGDGTLPGRKKGKTITSEENRGLQVEIVPEGAVEEAHRNTEDDSDGSFVPLACQGDGSLDNCCQQNRPLDI